MAVSLLHYNTLYRITDYGKSEKVKMLVVPDLSNVIIMT